MPDKGLDLYKTLKADPNYEGVGKDYESFKSFFSDEKNYKNLYNTLKEDPNYEGVGSSLESFADFFGLKKKVQSALPYESFATPFKTTTSTGERISSIDSPSPLNPQKNTSPSVSTEKGKPIDIKSGLSKSLRQQSKESEDFGVAPAIAAEEFKLEGDKRKRFIGETTYNIYSSVVEPNMDLFVSQKDQPTMYGTKKIPAGTVNTDAVYDAVDAYAEKYKEKTGEELDKEARQAIAFGITDQIKSRDKKFKAVALIDMDLKSQNLPTLSQLNIQAQDKVNKVKGLVEEKNNFIKYAIKNPDKQIMGEATSEVDMLKTEIKSQADKLKAEVQGFYESTFNAELQPVIRQYQQLVDTRQMTLEQANSKLKAAAESLSEKIKQDTNARYEPMYDELNSAAKQKSIKIQTKYNRKLQDKIKSQLIVFDKNIDALIKESDDLPPKYKKSVEEASKKAYGYLFKEEEAQKLQNFRNLNIGEKIGRAWETGFSDVLSTVGGAINMTGFDAQGINELSLKLEQLTGVPSAAWNDTDVMDSFTDLDWWIAKGVRSLPFTVFTMPIGIIGGRAFGTLASALNATKRAQMISSVVGGGVIGWEAERLLEAGGSYKEAIDNGMSREEAARIAKDSMDLQLSTLPMNIAQMLPFFGKGFKFMKSAGIEVVAGHMEEVQQGWAGQRAKNLAEDKEQRGIGEAVNSFGNYFFSKEALEEGVIGAVVGQAMTMASLTNTPDIDLQINSIMSSLSVGGESQARKMLEIMAKNGAISEAELKEYSNLIDYTLEGIAQTESFPVSDSIKASLVNKYVGLLKARALVTDDDNSLATQAAAELVQEKEKEIKNILKGTEPVYLVFPKGSDIPVVSTKEQVEQILKRPKYLEAFDIEIHNDQSTQAKLDEVNAAIETEKNKQNIQDEKANEEPMPEGVQGVRNEGETGQESAELRTNEEEVKTGNADLDNALTELDKLKQEELAKLPKRRLDNNAEAAEYNQKIDAEKESIESDFQAQREELISQFKPTESQAEALPTEQESKAKPVQEIPANIQEIANTVGENPNKVQNIYNKYGDKTKDVSEITQEDYDKAVKAREKSKEKIKLEAIEAKIKQGNLTKLEAKKEANKIEELKKQDSKQVKEVEDFMKFLPDLQKALLESGEIKTIDCKWGK